MYISYHLFNMNKQEECDDIGTRRWYPSAGPSSYHIHLCEFG